MDCRSIDGMVLEGESDSIEFKGTLPTESTKWLKTIVAFANGYGGTMIIGVDDSRNVIGVPDDSVFSLSDSMTSRICDLCEPQISMSASVQRVGEKSVVIIEVFPGSNKPYYIKDLGVENGTFIRVGATTRQASEDMIHDLRLQGSRLSFDTIRNMDVELTDERTDGICRSLSGINGVGITENTLLNSGIIRTVDGHTFPTNAYALLSDQSPFFFTEVRCAVFSGRDGVDFIDSADYPCPIHLQIENAFKFIKRNLKLSGKVDGLLRRERYDLPLEAVRESIVNAVQHRSYVESNKPIYVALYEDRLEITSPGGLPSPLNVDMMRQGRSSHRNPSISKIFRAARISEGWGNGVKTIFSMCKEYGLREPMIENSGIDVRVTLFREVADRLESMMDQPMGDARSIVLSMLESDPGMTVKGVSSSSGLSVRAVERTISDLKREGVLIRTGTTRNGQWLVRRVD